MCLSSRIIACLMLVEESIKQRQQDIGFCEVPIKQDSSMGKPPQHILLFWPFIFYFKDLSKHIYCD